MRFSPLQLISTYDLYYRSFLIEPLLLNLNLLPRLFKHLHKVLMRSPQLLCLVAETELRKYIISVLVLLRRFCHNFDADWRALLLLVIAWLVQCSKLIVRLIHYTLIWAEFVIHWQEKGAWVFKEGHGQCYLALICLLFMFNYSDPSMKFGVPIALCIGHPRHGKGLFCPLLEVLTQLWR